MIPVVADANALFGATTRGLLIHLDYRGLIRLHWSPLILEELSRALVDTGRKPDRAAARRHEHLMRAALPHAELPVALVQKHFEAVASAMRSAKDMHVAACAYAIVAGGYYPHAEIVSLVTNNIRDFGLRKLAAMGIEVTRPDAFLFDLFRRDARGVAAAFAALRATLRSAPAPDRPPRTLVRRRAGQHSSSHARCRQSRNRATLSAGMPTRCSSSTGRACQE